MGYDAQDYDGQYEFFSETSAKANKEHECDACGDKILPGDRYTKYSWKFEGCIEWHKRCPRCSAIYRHICEMVKLNGLEREVSVDVLLACGKDYEEEWGTEPPEEIQALAFALPGETTVEKKT